MCVNVGVVGHVSQETVLTCCKEHPPLAGLVVSGVLPTNFTSIEGASIIKVSALYGVAGYFSVLRTGSTCWKSWQCVDTTQYARRYHPHLL